MEQRREVKNNRTQHKIRQKTIKQKIRQAKNERIKEQCQEYPKDKHNAKFLYDSFTIIITDHLSLPGNKP